MDKAPGRVDCVAYLKEVPVRVTNKDYIYHAQSCVQIFPGTQHEKLKEMNKPGPGDQEF